MSSTKQIDDGGPAFPTNGTEYVGKDGMSLRDFFASQATEADIQDIQRTVRYPTGMRIPTRQQARFLHADEMLAVRKSTT